MRRSWRGRYDSRPVLNTGLRQAWHLTNIILPARIFIYSVATYSTPQIIGKSGMTATKLSSLTPVDGALIDLRAVGVVRGGRLLFQNVNLCVVRGGVMQLAGKNGVGKTSLLRVLAGVLPPAAGVVTRMPDVGVAYLPADDALWQGVMHVRGALADWARAIGLADAGVDDALARVGLAPLAGRSIAQLSMGQKRRLSWARIVVQNAPVWLLDEPFNSLDDAGIDMVRLLMTAHADAGGAIVAACHEQLPAQLGTHRVEVLDLNAVAT